MKRPASHVCAMFVYAAMIAVNVMLAFRGYYDWFTLFLELGCVVLFAGAFLSPQARWQYAVGMVILWLMVVRALYYTVLMPGYALLRHPPQWEAWLPVVFSTVFLILLFKMTYAFSFGKASRRFFGFEKG